MYVLLRQQSRGLAPIHMFAESIPRWLRAAEEDPSSKATFDGLHDLDFVLMVLIHSGADVQQRTAIKNLTALDIAFGKVQDFSRFGT